MSTTITRALADTYFSTRLENGVWTGFNDQDRDKAIVSAIDVVSRTNGSSIESETVDSTDYYYPDRAVYHQALYMLMNSDMLPNGTNSAPKWAGVNPSGETKQLSPNAMSREALKWLNWQNGSSVAIGRG